MAEIGVVDHPERNRYEARIGDSVAVLTYRRRPGQITFIHTGVPPAIEHHGVGSRLAQVALDAARADGLTVVPNCPFVAEYIREHPEYADLL
jgi:predicted GNAT family acetyltransferase